jgi:hypothetical protein
MTQSENPQPWASFLTQRARDFLVGEFPGALRVEPQVRSHGTSYGTTRKTVPRLLAVAPWLVVP